ncbi:TRAP-type C4-dicarboxylate transport system permease small subunit [Rhodovulum iodosum]|uniref:TRAP transporter small permease protein n=1 Tax=Rhodovulum iodosum TaxID=68291 RepID=A0ABV3XZW4_9RHOB|nr:TRAP transporter small permease subunit [Rhodovulum robiginosum]RSK34056.1 TRAP transporter small permease subunit [Rhodovulum robiginosum]
MAPSAAERRRGVAAVAAYMITAWAVLGGVLLLAVVAMNVLSVIGGVIWKPFPGDFEMTQVGVGIAAFAFLPYCQLTGKNVTADIFTMGAAPRWIARFRLAASAVALLFALLLLWRMWLGMGDQREYGYTTTILQFPIWTAFVPILVSLGLLALAAAMTLIEAAEGRIDGDRND